jgi:hypothetical protein
MKPMLLGALVALTLMTGLSSCATSGDPSRDAIRREFPEQYAKAERVAKCESGLRANAVSPGGGNWGLFQINSVHRGLVASMGYSWNQILDPYVNAKVARHIYNQGGWQPWGCRNA